MFKKVSLIIFLSVLLAGFLVVRHFWLKKSGEPTLIERLPEGDFLIRMNILDLADETSGLLHFNKVAFRDFASKEFLLGQAKSYGLDMQRPAYGFANENGDWGALLHVSDSAEVSAGILRLKKIVELSDTVIADQKVYTWRKEKAYLSYGKTWIFVFKGNSFVKYFNRVLTAESGKTSPLWEAFLKEKEFKKKSLVISSNSKGVMKYGVEKALFAHEVDSTSVTLLSYIKSVKPFDFSQKNDGLSLVKNKEATRYLNVHLNINELYNHKESPLYRLLDRLSKKISFPLDDFLKAWKGDMSFSEGDTQIVKEKFIESVMDDNFEVTEVVSVKETKVKGFSMAISMNQNGESLMTKLMNKGILTLDEGKYRFLISPPMNFKKQQGYYVFYSGEKAPALVPNTQNNGFLSYNRTPFTFYLDTINRNEAFGKIEFPVERLIRRNKFF
jgi:hypothetical protein